MVQTRKEQIYTLRGAWSKTSYSGTGGTASTNIVAATLNAASITGTNGGSTSTPTRGIVTAGTNIVTLRYTNTTQPLIDTGTNAVVFGRLTYLAGNYTVTYNVITGGAETAVNLPGVGAVSIEMLFPEVMNFEEVPASAALLDQGGFNTNSNTGSTSPNEIHFTLSGVFSGASTPGVFDPSYPIRTARTITEVAIIRRTAGNSGTTRVDIQINGVSIFASDGVKPQVAYTDGDNAQDIVSVFSSTALVIGDYLDAVLDVAEGGSVEGLSVIVRYE